MPPGWVYDSVGSPIVLFVSAVSGIIGCGLVQGVVVFLIVWVSDRFSLSLVVFTRLLGPINETGLRSTTCFPSSGSGTLVLRGRKTPLWL